MKQAQLGTTALVNTLRGFAALVVGICVIDWAVKLSHPLWFGGWYPHRVDRPALLMVLFVVPMCGLVAALFANPVATLGAGLLAGGTAANMLDLALNGVVWDMFLLPGTDVIFNFADVAITLGWILMLAATLLAFWQHREHLWNRVRNLQQNWG